MRGSLHCVVYILLVTAAALVSNTTTVTPASETSTITNETSATPNINSTVTTINVTTVSTTETSANTTAASSNLTSANTVAAASTVTSANTVAAASTGTSANTVAAASTGTSANTATLTTENFTGTVPITNDTTATIPNVSNSTSSNVTVTTAVVNGTSETTSTPVLTSTPNTSGGEKCQPDSCGNSTATCVELYKTFICQCPLNFCFVNSTCKQGDSFYGSITLSEQVFDAEKTSQEYTAIFMKVQKHFKKCFNETQGYLGTVINKISTTSNRNVQLVVSLVNLFEPNSVKEEEVIKIISANGIEGQIAAYESKTVCDGFYCDTETTTCKVIDNVNPPKCTCKEGRYSYTDAYTSCRACDPNCIGAGKHCVQALPSSIPECKCQPGYEIDSNTCKVCSFGFSGVECSNNYLLILVIVAAVGGALIIFSIGTIIGLSIRRKKNKSDSERTQLINKEINERGPATGGLFPKVHAKVDQGHVNRAVNPYEITDEYSRKTPKRDYDEDPWYEMSKKDRD